MQAFWCYWQHPRTKQSLFALWTLAIWVGSLGPAAPQVVDQGDKIQHFIGYATLAILAYRLWPYTLRVWLFAATMGVLVEIAQSFTPNRSFDPHDMLANALGAALGLLFIRCYSRWRQS
ncbi:VanZ family protein [Chitinibacter sp. ZOR0017]|uniref:VanZ family protein n=1 Tax=Chitinibacter sp. ZOR0017 TaxID=1339254 RepID=UPI00068A59F4|nr:VanZ family protein [Chitinibacter sp. ZOR0017]